MHNKLRREIAEYLLNSVIDEGRDAHTLLKRAFTALGGPVAAQTPPTPPLPVAVPEVATPSAEFLRDVDPGDECKVSCP